MPRHLTIDDLAAIAVPEAAGALARRHDDRLRLRTVDLDQDRELRRLWTVAVEGGAPAPLTEGPADSAPAWSPDGATVAFLRAEDDETPQVWLTAVGGAPRQLTTLPDGAGAPVWRPDGSAIAFVAAVDRAAPSATDQTPDAASTPRPRPDRLRPSRLPARRDRLPRHDPPAPAPAQRRDRQVHTAHRRRLGCRLPGVVARRRAARVPRSDRRRRRPLPPQRRSRP